MKDLLRPLLAGLLACSLTACSSPQPSDSQMLEVRTPSAVLDLPLKDLTGKTYSISQLLAADKTVALVFWQTWCSSCIAETPHLADAQRRFGDRLTILGVVSGPDGSVDDIALSAKCRELDLPYANVRDRSLALTEAFEVRGTPTIIVLARDGSVLFEGHESPADWAALL